MILTYNSLKEKMIQYPARPNETQYIENIPFFILLAQTKLSQKLRILGMQKIVGGLLDPVQSILQKPSNWVANVQFKIKNPITGQERILKYRNRSYLTDWSVSPNEFGEPEFYTDWDYNNFIIYPTPNVLPELNRYEFELIYRVLYEPLDENNQTNWATNYIPNLLFYACMAEAYMYFQTPQLKDEFKKEVLEGVQDVVQSDLLGKLDQAENSQQS